MRLLITGANGRMGQELIRAIAVEESVELSGALVRKGCESLGKDAGVLAGLEPLGISLTDDFSIFDRVDAVLDFTSPESSLCYARYAETSSLIHVIGTTGFSKEQEEDLERISCNTRIVKSSNMSFGINILSGLAKKAALTLKMKDFDTEILEMHHRCKVDAPSGTALHLGKEVAKGFGIDFEKQDFCGALNRNKRKEGSIGFASLRGGTVTGEHSVIFAGKGERIILSHIAEERSIFARGAIAAALWAKRKPYGLYSMFDVLGLSF
ncbi:MAG: 4-hydroxy-tetrahydrodipicolinate reductase [Candidatus Tokpelaia sp. JSC161]|jgi:4-hydroxy-tetrahydrodipicolinate reductase|nr:MAG: 4-hydroxy-tetrahydrodipicolinate reductase [Candidatus Tokpelaia sp. JSC161]